MTNRIIVNAYGDGNCAFNAFALGICDLIVQGKLEDDANCQAKALGLFDDANICYGKDFNDLKSYLSQKKNRDQLIELQKKLSEKLRKYIETIFTKTTIENDYKELTQHSLLVAYEDYVKEGSSTVKGDDIYRRHDFIKAKFEEIKNKKLSEEKSSKELIEWWMQEGGFPQFISAMAVSTVFAGDIELGILAKYFSIEVFVTRGENLETPLMQNKDELDSTIPSIYLRNEDKHWNYEADKYPEWLEALINTTLTAKDTFLRQRSSSSLRMFKDEKNKSFETIHQKLEEVFSKEKVKVEHLEKKAFINRDDHHIEYEAKSTGAHEFTMNSKELEKLKQDVQKIADFLKSLDPTGIKKFAIEIQSPDEDTRKELEKVCESKGFALKSQVATRSMGGPAN